MWPAGIYCVFMHTLEHGITNSPLPAPLPVRVNMPGRRAPAGLGALVGVHWNNRDLIWQMTKREVVGRYRGSILGLAWSFFHPLLMLGVYTFAFAYVFKVGPGVVGAAKGRGGAMAEFALYAFSGLILLGVFSEVATRSPTVILQNASYVKKVIFPLEVFPCVQVLAAAIHAGMSLIVLVIALVVFRQSVPATILLAPLVVVPLLLVILGTSWVLAAMGVFLRDVAQAMGVVTMMLMYLCPVFYRLDQIGVPWIRGLIRVNPLTIPLVNFRRVALDGVGPEWGWLGAYAGGSVLAAWAGFWFFQRFKRGFADVL